VQHGKRPEENQPHHDGDDTTEALQQLLVDQHGIGEPEHRHRRGGENHGESEHEQRSSARHSPPTADPTGRPIGRCDRRWGGAD
jgi:hypothetical protein